MMRRYEPHHVLLANKWGRAAGLFPAACGLFCTATSLRTGGRGLGRWADGLTDALVLAPSKWPCEQLTARAGETPSSLMVPQRPVLLGRQPQVAAPSPSLYPVLEHLPAL
jgi:hypothetical protein